MNKCTCAFPCGGTTETCPSAHASSDMHSVVLRSLDNEINRLEAELERCMEARREYINRNNLNKA